MTNVWTHLVHFGVGLLLFSQLTRFNNAIGSNTIVWTVNGFQAHKGLVRLQRNLGRSSGSCCQDARTSTRHRRRHLDRERHTSSRRHSGLHGTTSTSSCGIGCRLGTLLPSNTEGFRVQADAGGHKSGGLVVCKDPWMAQHASQCQALLWNTLQQLQIKFSRTQDNLSIRMTQEGL